MLKFAERAFAASAAFTLLLLMMVTLVDVSGRFLFNSPLPGATELTELGLAVVTLCMYPIIAYRQRHIVVDLMDGIIRGKFRRIQSGVAALIGVGLFTVIAWRLWLMGIRSIGYGDTTGTLGISLGHVFCVMAVMSGITAVAFASLLFHSDNVRPSQSSAGEE